MALAINLAYLNLPVFRYRFRIMEDAKGKLQTLKADHAVDPESVGHLDQLNDIRFLAEEEGSTRPTGFVMWWYGKILATKFDVVATMAFTVFAGLLVFAGAAHNAGVWQWLPSTVHGFLAQLIFYLLVASVALPPTFVALGRLGTRWAEKRSKHCFQQIAQIFARKAVEAQVPPVETPIVA
jgi:hypothetical protein